MSDIRHLIQLGLVEDLNEAGDITSQATIPENKNITATMRAREAGVLAGIDVAIATFYEVNPALVIDKSMEDGAALKPQDIILSISGAARDILKAERVALNFLSHLSGIASETAKYVAAVAGTNAQILDTRKTLPAYRALHKYAVKIGGGTNHRHGLYDMVLIKDNHIAAAGGVSAALAACQNIDGVKIEIEVDTLAQLEEVLTHGGADIIMLDNMRGHTLKQAVTMAKGKALLEASGGIDLNNIQEIAASGVDYISIGALTHSVRVLDIGLDILE